MRRRAAHGLLVFTGAEAALLLGLVLADAGAERELPRTVERRLVTELGLSDLALWSGTSYARHPSVADRFTPFSEHPGGFEHSPSGSIVPPPRPQTGRRR